MRSEKNKPACLTNCSGKAAFSFRTRKGSDVKRWNSVRSTLAEALQL